MAETEMTEDSYTEEYVCVEEYFPLDLHEEEVVAEPLDGQEITIIQPIESHEILQGESIIVESYDPGDPTQWTTEEVNEIVIDNNEEETAPPSAVIKLENDSVQTHVYECYKCAKRFNYKDKLFKHMKLHHARGDDMMIERDGKRIWTCTQCDKTFISRKGSIIHQRTHTGERPYSCSTCEKRFIDSSTLMKHQVIHQAVRPFTCLLCRRGFNQKVALQRHERTHGQIAPTFKCKYCPKTFLVGSSLQAHEKIHSGIKPYTCQYCPSRFHTSAAQRQHERVHTNERPYSCSYCPKAFKDSGTLFKHQVIHSGIRPFVCPICSQGFTQKVALRKHIRSHVTRNRDNICEVCDTPFFSKDDLCTHIEDHIEQHPSISQVKIIATSSSKNKQELMVAEKVEDDPPSPKDAGSGDMSDLATLCDVAISTAGDMARTYTCNYCGMTFRRMKFLNSHLAIHREGGSAMNCKHCNRLFPDNRSLQIHEKRFCPKKDDGDKKIVTATGPNATVVASISAESLENMSAKQVDLASSMKNPKRFFYCDQCDKTFSSRNGYIIHQRSHTGERPYPCRWCEKAFGDSATRHKHERIHTGERPFKCPRCPRAFNQRAALRAHQVTHTVDRAYICKYCPSSFPYFATLKRHQQSCHTNIPCPLCNVSVTEAKKLGAHIKNVHPFADYPQCTLCDSGKFADQSEFVEHMVWHGKQQQTEPRIENEAEKDKFEVVTLNDTLIKDEEIEEVIVPEVIEGVEEVYTEDTYSVSYMDGYSEEVYTEVDDTCGKEEIVEQTVITDFDVDTSTTVSIDISSQSFSCDVCHAEFNEKEALQEHVPLHF